MAPRSGTHKLFCFGAYAVYSSSFVGKLRCLVSLVSAEENPSFFWASVMETDQNASTQVNKCFLGGFMTLGSEILRKCVNISTFVDYVIMVFACVCVHMCVLLSYLELDLGQEEAFICHHISLQVPASHESDVVVPTLTSECPLWHHFIDVSQGDTQSWHYVALLIHNQVNEPLPRKSCQGFYLNH